MAYLMPARPNAQLQSLSVAEITREDAIPFILAKHYASRVPSISHSFGLFRSGSLVGIVTYGTPPSHTLLKGVAGEAHAGIVIELNRLTCDNGANHASFLVGRSLRMLPRPRIVVSYADTGVGHVGYVYQACNFLYTGMSADWMDPVVAGLEHQHHATFAHGKTNAEMQEQFGNALSFRKRTPKHRYIYICAGRGSRRQLIRDLRYEVKPYPKGDTKRHETRPADIQGFLFGGTETT